MTNEEKRNLSTADLVAATGKPLAERGSERAEREAAGNQSQSRTEEERLAPLFTPDVSKDFRGRWDVVQRGFVDDPRQAVRQADELVSQVMKSLAESFSKERARIEAEADEKASTENLRIAFRHYRSFFERLLTL
jgi:hypothetical protein